MNAPVSSGGAGRGIVIEAELATLSRSEERTRSVFVNLRHNYLDRPQSVERQPVSLSQRLTPQLARNTRRFQECPDLVRVNLTICHENASSMMIHVAPFPLD